MNAIQTTGYYLLKGVLLLFGSLPLKFHYANARFLAFLMEKVFRYRNSDVLINLSRCFPEKNYWEIREIYHKFYRHFADLIVEAIWFGACTNPKRLRKARIMEIANPELLDEVYQKAPGIVVMYSHCGNWELFGGIQQYNYTDIPTHIDETNFCVVYRRLTSAVWDRVMKDNRFAPIVDRKKFQGYIESTNIVRYAFKNKDRKVFYNINTDQRPYFAAPDSIKVKFFNDEVKTMSGAAAIAAKFGFAVLFLRMPVKSRGHYGLEYVKICDDASKMSVQDIMDKYYRLLETEIIQQPENYLWTHRRWWKR